MIDPVSPFIFSSYPRFLGLHFPNKRFRRLRVSSWLEVLRLSRTYNSIANIYISVYDTKLVFDKVVLDVDLPSIDKSLESARVLASKLTGMGLPYVPVFSGNRGFHFYVLFKPVRVGVEGLRSILDYFSNVFKDVRGLDLPHLRNKSAMTRLPNTVNLKSGLYCVYLPYEFTSWSVGDLVGWAREPRLVAYDLKEPPDLEQYVSPEFVNGREARPPKPVTLPGNVRATLEWVLRPCVYKYLIENRDPPHEVRTELVSELLWFGMDETGINRVISGLGWADYDPEVTAYHVSKIVSKRLMPYSCRRLKQLIPEYCVECGWVYWWGDPDLA